METVDDFAQLKSQLTAFTFLNGDGLTVSRLGLSITLFFKQGYILEKKQRILACYQRFREEFGSHLRFHRHELEGLKKYSPENIAKVEEGILNQKKNQLSGWVVSDGFTDNSVGFYESSPFVFFFIKSLINSFLVHSEKILECQFILLMLFYVITAFQPSVNG